MSLRFRLIIIVFLFILVLGLVSLNAAPGRGPTFPQRVMLELVGGLQSAVTGSARFIEGVWVTYFDLVGAAEENRELRRMVDKARSRLIAMEETRLANKRLTRLLNFTRDKPFEYLGARVVGWSPGDWFKTMNIDRGESEGVRIGMPVASDLGLVGRVIEVAPHFSKVLLIIDYNSAVDAFVQRSRVRGVLVGRSEKLCSLRYVLKNDDLVEGDVVVTSGMGGVFPPGLPLGTVHRFQNAGQDIFAEVDVIPAVDFDDLEEVLVLKIPQPPF
jgi:rod shape-determining protein MreC